MISISVFSQCPFNTKFGEIKAEDFTVKSDLIDSSTNAVILFDIGTCEIEATPQGMSNPKYTRHTRIMILNKNGYELSTIKCLSYEKDGFFIEMKNFKASTFNLEKNNIIETKFEKKSTLEEKVIKGLKENVYTLSNVKEGSIIEYSYTTVTSPTRDLTSWLFENNQPCFYSEFSTSIPSKFDYKARISGYIKIDSSINRTELYTKFYGRLWSGYLVESKWSANNIPPIKSEPFLTRLNNYTSKLDFRLYTTSTCWYCITNNLQKNKYFGEQIENKNEWLNKPVQDIINKDKDTVKAIFEFVRDSVLKINNSGIFITYNSSLKDVYNNRKGGPTDINMLLIAMLRKVHIDAYPAILSTRENGFINNDNPILTDYNYLMAGIIDTDTTCYFLDASNEFLGFKKLPLKCYNGSVRVLTEKTFGKFLTSDSLKENENSFVYISNEDDGSSTAICKETYGYYQSLKFREDIKNTPLNKVTELIQNKYPACLPKCRIPLILSGK